jgi:hypothetical protein
MNMTLEDVSHLVQISNRIDALSKIKDVDVHNVNISITGNVGGSLGTHIFRLNTSQSQEVINMLSKEYDELKKELESSLIVKYHQYEAD